MIPKINKILYATDLSKNSAYAFRYAIKSAEVHDAKIDMLNVLQIPRYMSEMDWSAELAIVSEETKAINAERLKKRLEEFVQRELKSKPEMINRVASFQVVEGDPAPMILQKADELKSDILIMGTHGKGLIAYTFLGSVAQEVLQRIRIPVFIIPIPRETDIAFND